MTDNGIADTNARLIESVHDESLGKASKCALCGKPHFSRNSTGGWRDQVCDECLKTYDETAAVVCLGCREVVFRLMPKRLPSGYEIRPGAVLHIASCPACRPENAVSTLIEVDQWEKENGSGRIILSPV